MANYTNITEINKDKVLLLIGACIQAYAAFSEEQCTACQTTKIIPPTGYEFVDYWTGVDSVFNKDDSIECYGVVFRSLTAPYTYIFAFRGTASFLDALDDIGMELTTFVPYDASFSKTTVPAEVKVEAGFYDVYSRGDKLASTLSMQNQLFLLIDNYQISDKPINQLYITGHSLGAALSELFTLDLALSRPGIIASNYNYACPRVGNQYFVSCYTQQPNQQNTVTRTLRVQNTYDKVPCNPPEALGFQHIPDAFLIAFYEEGWDGLKQFNLIARHASANYQAQLNCASQNRNGLCTSERLKVPASGYDLVSKIPDPSNIYSFF
jgi:triacylglycerol lipase